jgi:hypothetical protein
VFNGLFGFCGGGLDHGVLAVGYDADPENNYYIIKVRELRRVLVATETSPLRHLTDGASRVWDTRRTRRPRE